jgi:hypothetical protein
MGKRRCHLKRQSNWNDIMQRVNVANFRPQRFLSSMVVLVLWKMSNPVWTKSYPSSTYYLMEKS